MSDLVQRLKAEAKALSERDVASLVPKLMEDAAAEIERLRNPGIRWSPKRAEQAALDELARHGGNAEDIRRLREYFAAAEPDSQQPNTEIPDA
jgi:hypothetical protein